MKQFLKQNEVDALEEIRKHYTINPEVWQEQVIEKSQADLEFNLAAMREPGNNYNTFHDPNLPTEWIENIAKECNKHNININNINLTASTNNRYIAAAISSPPSLNREYLPATIDLSIDSYNTHMRVTPKLVKHIPPHEMTHLTQGHTTQTVNIIDYIAPIPTCPEISILQTSNWKEKYEDWKKECDQVSHQSVKSFKELPLYTIMVAAEEKTADTLLACDDAEIASNYMFGKKRADTDNIHTPYPANDNDIAVLDANWKATQTIEYSRKLYQLAQHAPQKLFTQLKKLTF